MTDAISEAAPQAAATGLTGAVSAPAEAAGGPPAAKRVRLGWTAAAAAAAAAASEQSAEPRPEEASAAERAGEGDACPPAEPLSRLFGSLWRATERAPTPGGLGLHNPSSSTQYRRRLASFARNPWCWCGSLWGARCSPLLCAQHGWRLAGFEALTCEHCASTLKAPASVEEAAVEQWAVLLQTAHEGWCPYRTAQCPDYGYTRFDSNMVCDRGTPLLSHTHYTCTRRAVTGLFGSDSWECATLCRILKGWRSALQPCPSWPRAAT